MGSSYSALGFSSTDAAENESKAALSVILYVQYHTAVGACEMWRLHSVSVRAVTHSSVQQAGQIYRSSVMLEGFL